MYVGVERLFRWVVRWYFGDDRWKFRRDAALRNLLIEIYLWKTSPNIWIKRESSSILKILEQILDFGTMTVNPSRMQRPLRERPSDGRVHRQIVLHLHQRQHIIAMGICGSKTEAVQPPAPTAVSLSRSGISLLKWGTPGILTFGGIFCYL